MSIRHLNKVQTLDYVLQVVLSQSYSKILSRGSVSFLTGIAFTDLVRNQLDAILISIERRMLTRCVFKLKGSKSKVKRYIIKPVSSEFHSHNIILNTNNELTNPIHQFLNVCFKAVVKAVPHKTE